MNQDWQEILVAPDDPIEQVLHVIDRGALRMALVVDADRRLLGVVADGDVRRGLLRHIGLNHPVREVMNAAPRTLSSGFSREEAVALMKRYDLLQLPVLDASGRLIGLESQREMLGPPRYDNPVFLMAGGFGKRLHPLTEACPKPMLFVGGKPILENILENFIAAGFHRFYISIHYLAERIKAYFGNGERWGVSIEYVEEKKPLGTGGALGLLPDTGGLPLLMMNGDLLTRIDFVKLLDYHVKHEAQITMCVREYDFQVPFGVVETAENLVTRITEKPVHNFFVNAGIYVLDPATVRSVGRQQKIDMPEIVERVLSENGKVVTFPVHEYWLDIGRMDDFELAQSEFDESGFSAAE